jgi:hypothetical protein
VKQSVSSLTTRPTHCSTRYSRDLLPFADFRMTCSNVNKFLLEQLKLSLGTGNRI